MNETDLIALIEAMIEATPQEILKKIELLDIVFSHAKWEVENREEPLGEGKFLAERFEFWASGPDPLTAAYRNAVTANQSSLSYVDCRKPNLGEITAQVFNIIFHDMEDDNLEADIRFKDALALATALDNPTSSTFYPNVEVYRPLINQALAQLTEQVLG